MKIVMPVRMWPLAIQYTAKTLASSAMTKGTTITTRIT